MVINVLGALVALAGVLVFILFLSNGKKSKAIASLNSKAEEQDKLVKELQSSLKKLQGENSAKGDNLLDNKDKLAQARRKNNELSQQIEKLKADLAQEKENYSKRDDEFNNMYAHIEKLNNEKAELEEKFNTLQSNSAKAAARQAAKENSQKEEVATPVTKQVIVDKNPELERKIAALQQDIATLKEKNKTLAEERSQIKRQAARNERRIDDFRRSDAVCKSRADLAEDKLHDLERRYYDVVSELAQLKGQVKN